MSWRFGPAQTAGHVNGNSPQLSHAATSHHEYSGKENGLGFYAFGADDERGVGSLVIAVLLASSVALQRGFAAVEGYAVAEGDQLGHVQDYVALDCRRAIRDQVGTASGGSLSTPAVSKGSWTNSGRRVGMGPDDSETSYADSIASELLCDAGAATRRGRVDANFKVQYGDAAVGPADANFVL